MVDPDRAEPGKHTASMTLFKRERGLTYYTLSCPSPSSSNPGMNRSRDVLRRYLLQILFACPCVSYPYQSARMFFPAPVSPWNTSNVSIFPVFLQIIPALLIRMSNPRCPVVLNIRRTSSTAAWTMASSVTSSSLTIRILPDESSASRRSSAEGVPRAVARTKLTSERGKVERCVTRASPRPRLQPVMR